MTKLDPTEIDWRLRIFDALSYPTLILAPDRTILAGNAKFYERNQVTPEDVLGKSCEDTCVKSRLTKHPTCTGQDCPIDRVLTQHASQSVVRRVIGPEEEDIWEERVFAPILGDNGEVKYIVESLRDITRVKKLEKKYSDVRELIDKVVQSSVSGIMAANRKGEIILMNKACEELFGYSNFDANRINIEDFYPPGVAREIMRKLRDETIGERGKLPSTQVNIITKRIEQRR